MRYHLTIAALAAVLAGCAAPESPHGQHCVVPVTRTIEHGGQTAEVPSCAGWIFGPTKRQREEFDRRSKQ